MTEKKNPFVPGASGNSTPKVAAGLHPAVLVSLFDVGTHIDPTYKKAKRKAVFEFELPLEPHYSIEEGGKQIPRTLSKNFNLSLHEKGSLRPLLESWRGKKFTDEEASTFDISNTLGRPCTVQVMHESKKSGGGMYANISTVLPAGKNPPKATIAPFKFSVDDLDDASELEGVGLPEWIKQKVMESEEYKLLLARGGGQSQQGPSDDEPGSDDGGW
jgi:hypothetical protein